MKNRIFTSAVLVLAVAAATAAPVAAQEAPPSQTKPFVDQTPQADAAPAEPAKPTATAKVVPELGMVITGGNTKTKTINGAITGHATAGDASLDAYFKALYGESRVFTVDPVVPTVSTSRMDKTAERWETGAKPAYNVHPRVYVFGTFDYVDDKFSGFDWVVTETGGLGFRVLDEEKLKLKLEGGPGGRHTRTSPAGGPPPTQIREDDFIGRAALNFLWQISDNASFTQDAITIFGPKAGGGIRTDSTTAVTAQLAGSLSLKASYNVVYVTDPPQVDHDQIATTATQQAKDVDSKVAINLIYTFNWDDAAGAKWW